MKACVLIMDISPYRIELFNRLRKKGIDIIVTEESDDPNLDYDFSKGWKIPGFSRCIPRHWKKLAKYDVIISYDVCSANTWLAFLTAKFYKKKFILWNELWVWSKYWKIQAAKPWMDYIMKNSDGYIAASTKTKELFIEQGVPKKKIFIAYSAAEDMRKYKIKKVNIPINLENKKVILYMSRLVPYKGLDILLDAFALIKKKRKDCVLLIGGDSEAFDFKAGCMAKIMEINDNDIYFIGNVQHDLVTSYYNLCDVFVLPAVFKMKDVVPCEAWGLVLNEAMSLGKPVVSTDAVAASFDLIKGNGYIAKQGSAKSLAYGIEKTLKQSKMKGMKSRIIIEDINFDKMVDSFMDAIKKGKMIDYWQIYGYAITAMAAVYLVPQIWKTLKTKKVDDLSYFFLVYTFVVHSLWCIFNVHIIYETGASTIPYLVNSGIRTICGLFLLILYMKYRRKEK